VQLYIVEDGKLVEYERLGECNQCGECCGGKNTITYQVEVRFAYKETEGDTYDQFKEDWTEWPQKKTAQMEADWLNMQEVEEN